MGKAVKPIRVFVGDDKKFIIAEGYVAKEHVEEWEREVPGWYRVRLVTKETPRRFYWKDGDIYWEVRAWVELEKLASEFEKISLPRAKRKKVERSEEETLPPDVSRHERREAAVVERLLRHVRRTRRRKRGKNASHSR